MVMYAYNKILNKKVKAGSFDAKTKIFNKTVKLKSKCWKYNTYGIEQEIIDKLKMLDCQEIVIKEQDTAKEYHIPFNEYIKHAFVDVLGNSTPQYYLSLKYFTCINKKEAV